MSLTNRGEAPKPRQDTDALNDALGDCIVQRNQAMFDRDLHRVERDRYREALGAILYMAGDSQEKSRIAREALEGGQA